MRHILVLQRFILEQQSTFLLGCSIHLLILLTNKLIKKLLHCIGQLEHDYIFLKLDICMAFNKMDWDFLECLLYHFGFKPTIHSSFCVDNTQDKELIIDHQHATIKTISKYKSIEQT